MLRNVFSIDAFAEPHGKGDRVIQPRPNPPRIGSGNQGNQRLLSAPASTKGNQPLLNPRTINMVRNSRGTFEAAL